MRSRSLLSSLASLSLSMLAVGCSGNNVVGTSSSSSSGTTGTPTSTSSASSSSSSTGTSSGSTGGSTNSTSSGSTGTDSGSSSSSGSSGSTGGGVRDTYPPPPYGVLINKTISDFTFDGYAQKAPATIPSGTAKANFSLQDVRKWTDASGHPFKFMLLDVAAGWCGPCNEEAESIGAHGDKKTKVAEWQAKGGVVVTVLAEGYPNPGDAVVLSDIDTWNGAHAVQSSLAIDEVGALLNQGLTPAAFPFNAIVDLDTMKILNAYYGDDADFLKWEAVLNAH